MSVLTKKLHVFKSFDLVFLLNFYGCQDFEGDNEAATSKAEPPKAEPHGHSQEHDLSACDLMN